MKQQLLTPDEERNLNIVESHYLDDLNFIKLLKSMEENISILSLNICSLRAKHDQLVLYIEYLKQNNSHPSIICVQETWLSERDDVNILNIPGYAFLYTEKSASKKGGLGMYIHKSLKFDEVKIDNKKAIWEGQFITVYVSKGKKIIIGNVYRPPRESSSLLKLFIENFTQIIQKIRRGRELMVAGDFNIDLLKISSNNLYFTFFESLCTLALLPRITHPTRITNKSQTLIDNIFCCLDYNINETEGGILTHAFSDHQPCCIFLKTKQSRTPCPKGLILCRKHTNESETVFLNQFNNNKELLELKNMNIDENPDKSYDLLNRTLQTCMNIAYPTTNKRFNKYINKKNPWITESILQTLKTRDKLFKKKKSSKPGSVKFFSLTVQISIHNKYLKKQIIIAKRSYYNKQFLNHKHNIKKHGI